MTLDDDDIVRVARALVDDPGAAGTLLAGLDGERVAAIAAHVAKIAATVAKVAAQAAAEAVARGVDGGAVEAEPGSAEGVLELVYRAMETEPATGGTDR